MRKILFHGNCQSCVVARWFKNNYSHKYKIIDCTEAGLTPFWGRSPAFSMWSPDNKYALEQDKTIKLIQEKVKEADIFVFMHHTTTINELGTINLHDNIAKGLKICLPNSRFGAYPICKWSLKPYIDYIKQNISNDPIKIVEYLKNEDDPVFTELLHEQYPFERFTDKSISKNIEKYKECINLYDTVISINDFVEKNWKDHLLFCTINHPANIYYIELISRLLNLLGEDLDLLKKSNYIPHPNGIKGKVVNVNEFLFFKKNIPNLLIPDYLKFKSVEEELY